MCPCECRRVFVRVTVCITIRITASITSCITIRITTRFTAKITSRNTAYMEKKYPQYLRPSPPTGYLEQGLMVKDPSKLRKNYIKSWGFKLDLISILPTDLVYLLTGTNCDNYVPGPVLVRVNRLLR